MPYDNLQQAQLVPHIRLLPVQNLQQLYTFLATGVGITALDTEDGILPAASTKAATELSQSEIFCQNQAKRGLEIAAAGGHNIFFSGPPGTGKSMLAKALPSILPKLTHEEILEVTQLHSLVTSDFEQPVMERPFRSPHHSASLVSLIGGGHNLRPGEISLSHRGVLFLDEMPEFSRTALEALRQPLEDHTVTVARAKDTVEYPANFILVATANPCPCGYYGSSKPCVCPPHLIARYQQRISGPILDRIDLHAAVQDIDHASLLGAVPSRKDDTTVRARILAARNRQEERYRSATKLNSSMSNRDIRQHARLEPQAKSMLDTAAARLGISARSYMKVIKVARTIADLEQRGVIGTAHIAEALQYRHQEAVIAL
jgi:magnesium chelatase family protein